MAAFWCLSTFFSQMRYICSLCLLIILMRKMIRECTKIARISLNDAVLRPLMQTRSVSVRINCNFVMVGTLFDSQSASGEAPHGVVKESGASILRQRQETTFPQVTPTSLLYALKCNCPYALCTDIIETSGVPKPYKPNYLSWPINRKRRKTFVASCVPVS